MATKKVNLVISLKDGVSAGLQKIGKGLKVVAKGFKAVALAGTAAMGALTLAGVGLGKTIKKAFDFETMRTQIKVLTGSVKSARTEFKRLRDFSAQTPFQIEGIVEAYRNLKIFTGEALSSRRGLELVGDAAAATGRRFEEVAFWTGRLYSALKNGDPFMDSVGALQRMGIVGGEIRGTLTRLTKQGASFGEVWQVVEKDLNRFTGGMRELSSTGNGLISTLKDNWNIALATFGETFMDVAKNSIQTMIDTIQKLVKDGTITKWAEQAKGALDAIVETIKIIKEGGEGRAAILKSIGNIIVAAFTDAANASVKILAKHAPRIGEALGKAAKNAFKIIDQDRVTGEQKQQARRQTRIQAEMLGIRSGSDEWHEIYDSLVEEMKTLNRESRFAEEGRKLEESIGSFGTGLKEAIEQFNKAREEFGTGGIEGRDITEEFRRTGQTQFDGDSIAQRFRQTGQTQFWDDSGAQAIADRMRGAGSVTQAITPSTDISRQVTPESVEQAVDPSAAQAMDKQSQTLESVLTAIEEQNKILNEKLGGVSSS